MEYIFGPALLFQDKTIETNSLTRSSYLTVLFSASWSIACHEFLESYTVFYEEANSAAQKVNTIWVSLDRNRQDYENSLTNTDWYALPFNSSRLQTVLDMYQVASIPSLLLIDHYGRTLTQSSPTFFAERSCFEVLQVWNELSESSF